MDPDVAELFEELLEYLPEYRVLVCKKCRFAIQPSAVANHLKRHQLYRDRRKRLLDAIDRLQLAEPREVSIPPPNTQAIPALPVYNGYKCLVPACGYNCASLKRIQSHESASHGHPASIDVNCKQACLQTFFQGTQIKYFEVTLPPELANGDGGPTSIRRPRNNVREITTPESPIEFAPSNPCPPSLALEDLKLMHQFTFETAMTLYRGSEPEDFWVRQIPLYASGCEYLMRGILSLAAAHIAFLEPSNSLDWAETAARHHTEGLSLFRSAVSMPEQADNNAAVAFSRILTIYKCADYQMRMTTADDHADFSRNALVEYLFLVRGGCHLATHSVAPHKFQGSFLQFLPVEKKVSPCGEIKISLPFDVEMRLSELGSSLLPLLQCAGANSPEDFEAIHSAINGLRIAFSIMAGSTKAPSADWDAVDYWPTVISDRYCHMIKEQQPVALVVFAHFCILLHWHSRKHWFMASHGKFLLESISSLLEEEQYSRLISWPRKQLGI